MDPIDQIKWLAANSLKPNDYNPNFVFKAEMILLEESILRTGWIQPILVSKDLDIIDGFHRWKLSTLSTKIYQKYGGLVPCAILDISPAERKMLTIRINKAKGTHQALDLHQIVKSLVDEFGLSLEEVGKGIGTDKEETMLLYEADIFKARHIRDHSYSKSWHPVKYGRKKKAAK